MTRAEAVGARCRHHHRHGDRHLGDLRQVDQDPHEQHGADRDRRAHTVQDGGPLLVEQVAPARRCGRRLDMPVLHHPGDDDRREDADGDLEAAIVGDLRRLQRIVQGRQQHHAGGDGHEQPGQAMRAHLHGDHAQHGDAGQEQIERDVIVGQPARHDEADKRADDGAGEAQQAAPQRARAGRHQRHVPAGRRPPRRLDLQQQRQHGGQHDRAGGDDALPAAHRVLAELLQLAPVANQRVVDHVVDLHHIVDHLPGKGQSRSLGHGHDRGKITARASAPM